MNTYIDQIPEKIREHIRIVAKNTRLPESEAVEALSKGWLEKKNLFEEQIRDLGMEEIVNLEKNDPRGLLVMTYSGSLLNIGPLVNAARKAEYASIGIRTDVPETAIKDNSELKKDVNIDEEVQFETGPIKSSSPAFKIAVFSEELAPAQQEERLSRATQILTTEFIETNKTNLGSDSE